MDVVSSLASGFATALQPAHLLYCFLGVFIGTLVGVLPGIGPIAAMSLLLPYSFGIEPAAGIIMLAGIYYGTMYGGSTTSILVNIPGEAASVVTTLDGYQMALSGRAGAALGMAALASFIAGTFSVIALMLLAPPLAAFAIRFGPVEYVGLMVLGLTIVTYLAQHSLAKALLMTGFGIVLGLIGLDSMTGQPRLTFGASELVDGIGLVPIVMGAFGLSEILLNIERSMGSRTAATSRIGGLMPSRSDWFQSRWALVRGTVIGFLLGILPGGGSVISSFTSYAVEKRMAKDPSRFGKGAIEGVAGPEAANNSAAGGAFIPLFSLGIPPNAMLALLLGALIVHGLQPGPLFIEQQAPLFWTIIASMYVGNLMLLVLNLPLIGLWVQLLKVPYRLLFPMIMLLCVIGVYSTSLLIFDVYVMIFFGVLGYLMKKFQYEPAPLVLGYVLGPLLENNLRKALITNGGDWSVFVRHPISAVCLGLATVLLVTALLPWIRSRRAAVPLEA